MNLLKLAAIHEAHERLATDYRGMTERFREVNTLLTELRAPRYTPIKSHSGMDLRHLQFPMGEELPITAKLIEQIAAAKSQADRLQADIARFAPIVHRSAQLLARFDEYARSFG